MNNRKTETSSQIKALTAKGEDVYISEECISSSSDSEDVDKEPDVLPKQKTDSVGWYDVDNYFNPRLTTPDMGATTILANLNTSSSELEDF